MINLSCKLSKTRSGTKGQLLSELIFGVLKKPTKFDLWCLRLNLTSAWFKHFLLKIDGTICSARLLHVLMILHLGMISAFWPFLWAEFWYYYTSTYTPIFILNRWTIPLHIAPEGWQNSKIDFCPTELLGIVKHPYLCLY